MKKFSKDIPPQKQFVQPGKESDMNPKPIYIDSSYKSSDKLKEKVALITGGDSGIGRSISILYAKEGADVAIIYLNEEGDAEETKRLIELENRKCLLIKGDIGSESFCKESVEKTIKEFGKLNILINNAGEQHPQGNIEDISEEQLIRTFRTNIFAQFFMVKASLPYLNKGDVIINTTSVTAYKGNPQLLDYSATKGAILSFTRSLSHSLINKGIRVNTVAPGPIWTPLIPATFPKEHVDSFGKDTLMQRPGQPFEVATCFVFLASSDSSYITGQTLHPNGGEIVNG